MSSNSTVKTTVYLTAELADTLDEARHTLRGQGHRQASATGLIRAALRLARDRHPDDWLALAGEER